MQIFFHFLGARIDLAVTTTFEAYDFVVELSLQIGQILVTLLLVHFGDHVGREVDDLLEILRSDVQQVAQTARHALEIPDVGDRGGQLDVAHTFAAHARAGDFHTAAFAHDALEAHALVLAARALPVTGRAEDLLAEQTVLLRLEGTVIDGFRLLDLAIAPAADVVGGGHANAKLVKCVDVQHS